jgi:hypothetical protein
MGGFIKTLERLERAVNKHGRNTQTLLNEFRKIPGFKKDNVTVAGVQGEFLVGNDELGIQINEKDREIVVRATYTTTMLYEKALMQFGKLSIVSIPLAVYGKKEYHPNAPECTYAEFEPITLRDACISEILKRIEVEKGAQHATSHLDITSFFPAAQEEVKTTLASTKDKIQGILDYQRNELYHILRRALPETPALYEIALECPPRKHKGCGLNTSMTQIDIRHETEKDTVGVTFDIECTGIDLCIVKNYIGNGKR